jgi:HlyD family secretion protein
MSRKNVVIAVAVVLAGAAVVAANLYFRKDKGLPVTTDVIKARDLEAIVSASGKIQPKRLVNISAETAGRVVDLAVNEGDRIKKGQFLLQIDPKSLRRRWRRRASRWNRRSRTSPGSATCGRSS